MSIVYTVQNIPCALCFKPIKEALKAELNIDDVVFRPLRKKIIIKIPDEKYSPELHLKITKLLERLGHAPQQYSDLFQGAVGTIAGLVLLLLPMLFGSLPLMVMVPISVLCALLTLALGAPSFKKAWMEWRTFKFSMDSLFAVSSVTALLVSFASFWVPSLPMMFDMGLLMFGFRHLGQVIEESLAQESQLDTSFCERLPKSIRAKKASGFELTLLQDIQVGDEIEIDPEATVPLDGECLDNHHRIFDTLLNGSSLPRKIKRNELLLSGMVVAKGNGPLRLKVTKRLEDSNLSLLDQQIDDAQKGKQAQYQILADKVLQYFIPAVFLLSAASGGVIACFFPWDMAIRAAIGVLVSACPCTLSLVVPLAVQMGMRKVGLQGVQFKDSDELQKAGEVSRVVFDLNGTLTTGKYDDVDKPVILDSSINEREFLSIVGALEKGASHPIGQALHRYASKPNENILVTEVDDRHSGVRGKINNEYYALGNVKHMMSLGIDMTGFQCPKNPGGIVSYLARGNKIIGSITVKNSLRLDAVQAVRALHKLGKKVYICTGSDRNTAEPIAQQLGVPLTNLLVDAPDAKTKADYIKRLQVDGHNVAMVGDSANDSTAMKAGHFGLAIDSVLSDPVTKAKAGAVTRGALLWPVVAAFAIAKQTVSTIKQNLWFNLIYNIAAAIFMGGGCAYCGMMVNPSIGVLLMIVQMCLILANSWRFQQQDLEYLKKSGDMTPVPEEEIASESVNSLLINNNNLAKSFSPVYSGLYVNVNRGEITKPRSSAAVLTSIAQASRN